MDDSFAFRTTVPLRRQLDPRVLKAGAFLLVVLLGVGVFANWVIASERRSFAEADRQHVATDVAVSQIRAPAPLGTDADAREAARAALLAARAAFAQHRSFLDAGPARLSELQPAYIYVDGPSTMPRVVSVASTRRSWAAATMGPAGTCYWIRTTGGVTYYGTDRECTGRAALRASERAWPTPAAAS